MTAASARQVRPVAAAVPADLLDAPSRDLSRSPAAASASSSPSAARSSGCCGSTPWAGAPGKTRVAMVGYFEDGPNLVTLAMNGWGKAEPAWWLNLQAEPDGHGRARRTARREVRARAASGAERERLWATFDEYPGWGAESAPSPPIDPARRRSSSSSRRQGRTDERGNDDPGGRRRARRPPGAGRGRAGACGRDTSGSSPDSRSRSSRTSSARRNGVGILLLIAFGIAPDVPRLFGIGRRRTSGRVLPLRVFNCCTTRSAPVARHRCIAATGIVPAVWLVGSLVWLGHVVIGWGVGDVRRHQAAGSQPHA